MDRRPSPRAFSPRTETPNLPATVAGGTTALRAKPQLTRRYETQYLKPNGDVGRMTRVAPAQPVFEATCAAIARGTLIETEYGPMAIEDLEPGVRVKTVDNGFKPILWRGTTLVLRGIPNQSPDMGCTLRVTNDRFGFDRPSRPLMLGPKARVLTRTDTTHGFRPIADLVDGETVISVEPMSPVEVYHIAMEEQQVITASGVPIETYHPGRKIEKMIPREALSMLMSFFPHLSSMQDFGEPAHARLDKHNMMSAI